MPRKSNKTSYVMNLITNGEPAEEEQAQEGQSQQDIGNSQGEKTAVTEEGQSGQVNAQQTAPSVSEPSAGKIVVVDEDEESEKLSEEIKSQLELQLEAELEEMEVLGFSGGGEEGDETVVIYMNGKKVINGVEFGSKISEMVDLSDEDDVEMLEDLIMAAINDGYKKADEAYKEKMGPLGNMGGLNGLL